MPYSSTKVAWLPRGSVPVMVEDHCAAANKSLLHGWQSCLLNNDAEHARRREAAVVKRPYQMQF
jgi:hypothetical protein